MISSTPSRQQCRARADSANARVREEVPNVTDKLLLPLILAPVIIIAIAAVVYFILRSDGPEEYEVGLTAAAMLSRRPARRWAASRSGRRPTAS